jgi:hypothetical protein
MMSSVSSVRALFVYILVLPMALLMGYLLASPTEFGTWAMIGTVLLILVAPLALTRHHAFLFLTWNMTAMAFFLPGQPPWWMVMAAVSLAICLFQRALSKERRFLSVPSLLVPLAFLGLVVLVTAQATGGFGIRIFGSENVGGKRYFTLLGAMAGFLAMISQGIPEEKSKRYVALFFLGGLINSTSTLLPFLGPGFYFLFLFFPSDAVSGGMSPLEPGIIRMWGSSVAAMSCFFYLLARYGVRELFSMRKPLRPLLLLALVALGSSGGFRSFFVLMVLTFVLVFYFEGLMWSKYALAFLGGSLLICTILVPTANRLPLSIQRALSVLPINVNPIARYDAAASSEWRIQMWRILLPEVPRHLWLGKGLGISRGELDLVSELTRRGMVSSQEISMLAGDYHNGPLSVIIPFGIWGLIAFIWFLIASIRALYANYCYGEERLKKVNTFLLAYFIARALIFMIVFGGFYSDLAIFAGIIGLSISLNSGIRRPVTVPVIQEAKTSPELELPGSPVPSFNRAR